MAALGSNMKGRSKKPTGLVEEVKKSNKPASKDTKPKAVKPKAAKEKKTAEAKPVKDIKAEAQKGAKATVAKKAEVKKENKSVGTPKELKLKLKDAQIVLQPSKRKKIRKVKVFLEGELNINNVEAFIERIHPIFNDFDYVDFYLKEVSSLDLCFIQMLYHMQRSYAKKKKEVTIDSELEKELKSIVVQAGFEELMFIPKLV